MTLSFDELESQGRHHWSCIVKGEQKIDVDWLGPPIKVVHPGDLETLRRIGETSEDPALPFCNMRENQKKSALHGATDEAAAFNAKHSTASTTWEL
eukprot:g17994.t1